VTADAGDVLTGCESAQPPAPPPAKVTPTFTFKLKDRTAQGALVKKLVVGGLSRRHRGGRDAQAEEGQGEDQRPVPRPGEHLSGHLL